LTVYVDTSAAAKLIVDESESPALSAYLDGLVSDGVPLVSGALLETELRRLAVRHRLSQTAVSDVLDRFDLFEPDRAIFVEAGVLPGASLRSLDALHIVVAVRLEADVLVTYDVRQTESAQLVGLRVVAPA
jgi:predicted nucleic acid-binding protein